MTVARNDSSKECRVIRITSEIDATSVVGKYLAATGCISKRALIFASILCTGGCPWNHMNNRTPEGKRKIDEHVRNMVPLFRNFAQLCLLASATGCYIHMEWPAGCVCWKRKDVVRFIEFHGLVTVKFNGCSVGLTNARGELLSKPWRIVTNCRQVVKAFQDLKCTRDHNHAVTSGSAAKSSENYTVDFVKRLHEAFNLAVSNP